MDIPGTCVSSLAIRPALYGALLTALAAYPAAAADQACGPAPEAAQLPAVPVEGQDGDLPLEITSDGAVVDVEGNASLLGHVQIRQGSRTLSAENATYDQARRAFKVDGKVEYRDPDLRVYAESGTWSDTEGSRFERTEFELPQRPARGEARELGVGTDGDLALQRVRFTTCPLGNEDWLLRASEITIDRDREQGTAREVRLDFLGLPLLYTPWLSFPAGSSRKTGFLFPTVGTSSSNGIEFSAPYYLNLAPNYDATLEPIVFTNRGLALDGSFRYLSPSSSGRLQGRILPSDRRYDADRGYLKLTHETRLGPFGRVIAHLEQASDRQYFEDFAKGPEGTSITHLERRLAWEILGNGWRGVAAVQNFQTIDQFLGPDQRPYSRLPQLALTGQWALPATGLRLGLTAEAAWFERDVGVRGARLDLAPRLSWPLRTAGIFLEPAIGYRQLAYALEDTLPGDGDSPSVGAPTFTLDSGLILDRPLESRGMLQTLEPQLLYVWTPFREQGDLPVFDTALPTFDRYRLFNPNRFVGGDRIADVHRLAIGLTSRLLDTGSGRQLLSATLGQEFNFETPRVALPDEGPGGDRSSDLVAELSVSAYRQWSVDLGLQWDPEASTSVLTRAFVQYRPGPATLVNLGYRYRAGEVEQWEFSTRWQVASNWQVFARHVYSAREEQAIDTFAGLEYEACCWKLRVFGGRYVSNRTGEQDTSVSIQLELKGLSSVGSGGEAFPGRGIRGYSRRIGFEP
ncbi:MAG: LPS-assembly protein LptD [Steroidobacteraceae bacterium]